MPRKEQEYVSNELVSDLCDRFYFLTGPIRLIWVQSLLCGCIINEGFSAAIVTPEECY